MTDIVDRLNDSISAGYSELRKEAAAEITRLRARIEDMEQQKPVGWFARIDGDGPLMECKHADISRVPLYAIPGAQPAPSINPAALSPVINWLRNGCDPMKAADELEMLAASPEAKP